MLDVEAWLETAGEPVAKTAFPPDEVPPLPYVVFLDTEERGGGDLKNMTKRHSLTVERYCMTQEGDEALEALLDVQAIKYQKEQQWVDDAGCFMSIFTFDLLERV